MRAYPDKFVPKGSRHGKGRPPRPVGITASNWTTMLPGIGPLRQRVFVTCHYCSYSPPNVPPNGVCPKCGGHSWERYALPVRSLQKTSNASGPAPDA